MSLVYSQSAKIKDSLVWLDLKTRTNDNYYANKLDSAFYYAHKTIAASAKVFGKQSINYALDISNLGELFKQVQDYQNAEPLLKETVNIIEKKAGRGDSDYATAVYNLALYYQEVGKYALAEKLNKQALNIREKIFGAESLDCAQSLNNLGTLYAEIENYTLAESCLKKAIAIKEKIDGKDDPDYAQSIGNLAEVYERTGRYNEAEPLYRSVVDIMGRALGKEDPEYEQSLNNLASFYFDMGNYTAAGSLYKQCLVILKTVFVTENAGYATTMNNLANVYYLKGEYDTALTYLLQGSAILRASLGEKHPVYAKSLNQLGNLYLLKHNYDSAAYYYGNALTIVNEVFGANSTLSAKYLTNIGVVYTEKGDHANAAIYLDKGKQMRKKLLGVTHPDYSESFNAQLGLYYASLDQSQWASSISGAIDTWENSVKYLLLSFSEKQKETYLANHLPQKDIYLSMLYYFQKRGNIDTLSTPYYKMITSLQGWLLSGSQQLTGMVEKTTDSALHNLYEKWGVVKKQYSVAIQLSLQKRKQLMINVDSLQQRSEDLEMSIINKLPALKAQLNNAGEAPKDLSLKLKQEEALVNLVSFRYKNPHSWTDSVLYGAFITLPGDSVAHFKIVCEQTALKELLKHYYNSAGRGAQIDSTYSTNANIGADLYKLVWQPLLPWIGNAKKIFLIPSGLLNKVSFQSLVDTAGKTLLDATEIHLLNNVAELAQPGPGNNSLKKNISLFGGADFDRNSAGVENEGASAWRYLPGTDAEVKELSLQFKNKGWHVTLDTGILATEGNLKAFSGSNAPYILHVATHGFYLPDTTKLNSRALDVTNNTAGATNFPLLRNGLLLSGANFFWGKDSVANDSEDGIVTAQEVANLNFNNTSLVTLSACESALGDINSNEGVYGLQRAFKIAGAKDLLITLWEIPDKETQELMRIFYKGVLSGDSYYIALKNAQLEMKKNYPNPAIWAGFELIGE